MTATLEPRAADRGLTSSAAAEQLRRDGPNTLRLARPIRLHRIVLRQLRETVILVLLVAAVLTAAVGDVTDMTVIIAVVVLNTALGASQELRSGRALEALADLTAPRATVVRDGNATDLPAAEVVRGDLLVLGAGDIVAADARVVTAHALQLDESAMTGESVPVARGPGEEVCAGSVATRGNATATVLRTGRHTALGRIGQAVGAGTVEATPLQRQLARLGRQLALLVSVAALVVGVLNLVYGHDLEVSVVVALSLAVAAIPESLPAVVALSLAMAARRMGNRGVLVRRLAAVETLGSVTVLAVDKTGTLTQGRMRLAGTSIDEPASTQRDALLTAAVLCNDASADGTGERDDPTEVALVDAAREAGCDVARLRAEHPRTRVDPFDAELARMTTWHTGPDGAPFAVSKGSPEAIGALVGDADSVTRLAAPFARRGQRVLAVIRDRGAGWELLGLVALADPPRAEAVRTVGAFRDAGVRVVMITGDHLETAQAIARAVGFEHTDGEGTERQVFARVAPDGKSDIVATLRRAGDVVAMTGDGVNDAPAMRAADIGIAMGRRGTEVAKQAADLVLVDDDLTAMIPAVAEGRRAWDNLRRFLHYALAGGIAEVLVMLFGPAFGMAVPLQAGQILWVNLLTHGLPGVAMGNEPAADDVLHRPPRAPGTHLLDAALVRRILAVSAFIALGSLLAGMVVGEHAQTAVFLSLTLAQLGVGLALRPTWRAHHRNPLLLWAVAVNVLLLALAVWWEPLRVLLHTTTLHADDVALCALTAVAATVVALVQRRRP